MMADQTDATPDFKALAAQLYEALDDLFIVYETGEPIPGIDADQNAMDAIDAYTNAVPEALNRPHPFNPNT